MLEIIKIIRVIGVLGFAIVMTLLAIRLEQRLCRRDFRLPIRLSPVIKWYHPFAFLGLTLALAQLVRLIIEKAQHDPKIAVAPAEPGFPSTSFMLAEGTLRIAISLLLIWRFSLLWPTTATAVLDRIKLVGSSIYMAVKMLLIWVPCVMGAVLIARLDQGADNPHILFQMLKSATSFDLLAIYVTVALVAPISEELLFRGLLQGAIIHSKYLGWLHRPIQETIGTDAESTSDHRAPQTVELGSDLRSPETELTNRPEVMAEADQSLAPDDVSNAGMDDFKYACAGKRSSFSGTT